MKKLILFLSLVFALFVVVACDETTEIPETTKTTEATTTEAPTTEGSGTTSSVTLPVTTETPTTETPTTEEVEVKIIKIDATGLGLDEYDKVNELSATIEGLEIKYFELANGGAYVAENEGLIQMRAEKGYLYNTTATGTEIEKIVINYSELKNPADGQYAPSLPEIFFGSESQSAATEGGVTQTGVQGTQEYTYTAPAGSTYFKIFKNSKFTVYIESFEIYLK